MRLPMAFAAALLTPGLALAADLKGGSPSAPVDFEAAVKPVLQRSCYACHNTTLKNADVNLMAFETEAAILQDHALWSKVVEKMRTKVMPPAPFPPMAEEEIASRDRLDRSGLRPRPGQRPSRPRAGHRAPAEPHRVRQHRARSPGRRSPPGRGLPAGRHGLRLRQQRRRALAFARAHGEVRAGRRTHRAHGGLRLRAAGSRPGARPLHASAHRAQHHAAPRLRPHGPHPAERGTRDAPLPGERRVRHPRRARRRAARRLGAPRGRPVPGRPGDGRFSPSIPRASGSFFDDRQDFSGKPREFRLRVAAGEHWLSGTIVRLYEGLPVSYGGPNPSKRPVPPPPEFKPPTDATPEKIEASAEGVREADAGEGPRQRRQACLASRSSVPTRRCARRARPACGPCPSAGRSRARAARAARARSWHALVRRAYRRPATAADLDPLVRLVTAAEGRGESFDDGLRIALSGRARLPRLPLPRRKGARGGRRRARPRAHRSRAGRPPVLLPLGQPARRRAARPRRPRRAARARRCSRPQVRRMLTDPKAQALVEAFGGQWLQFRALESVSPDREQFPDFDNDLRMSMRRETELFFESLMREDRSLLDLLDADYSFLNERLARHYGIAGREGAGVPEGGDRRAAVRGGVLTHASVLTVSSYATRTSPVLRGKWILENVLNAPPPDPPAGTPRLDEDKVGADASLRKQLEAHRTNATCAACHPKMDPLGFSLENFDGDRGLAQGRRQVADRRFRRPARRPLLRGAGGAARRAAPGRPEPSRSCVTEKMLTYALGRGLERYDKPTVKASPTGWASGDYRFSALVLEIVKSLPFQRRREEDGLVNWVTREAPVTADGPARARGQRGSALARRHASGLRRHGAGSPRGWRSPTCRTASRWPTGRPGRGPRLRALPDPEAARAVRDAAARALGSRPQERQRARRRPRRPRPRRGLVPDRRPPAQDRGRRHPERHLRRPGRRAALSASRRGSPRSSWAARSRARSATATRATAAPTPTASPGAPPRRPNPPETNPRMAFERLFGADDGPLDAEARARRARDRRSVLDLVSERSRTLQRDLGPAGPPQARRVPLRSARDRAAASSGRRRTSATSSRPSRSPPASPPSSPTT